MENESFQEEWELNFAGLKIGSHDYDYELEKLAHAAAPSDSIHPIRLKVYTGTFDELNAAGLELDKSEEMYTGEELTIILKEGAQTDPVLALRAKTVTKYENGVERKATYLLPRYEGFSEEIVNDPEKFSNALFYFLGISVERFKWQDQIFYRDIFDEMEEPGRDDKDDVLGRLIRPGFIARHNQNIQLPKSVWDNYKRTTRLLRDIIFIRLAPDYEETPEDIFEIASNPMKNIPGEVITSPNEVLDCVLRLLVLCTDTIIIENQLAQKSRGQEEFPFAKNTDNSRSRMAECFDEAQKIHTALISARFDTTNSKPRHKLDEEGVRGFKDMYAEIAGELFKTIMMCNGDEKFRLVVGGKIFGDRIRKLVDSIDDITATGEEASNSITGIEPYFRKACQYVAVSARVDKSKEIDRERKNLKHQIYDLSVALHTEGAKRKAEESSLSEKSTAVDEENKQHKPIDETTWLEKTANSLSGIHDLIPDISRSKRPGGHYTERLREEIRDADVKLPSLLIAGK